MSLYKQYISMVLPVSKNVLFSANCQKANKCWFEGTFSEWLYDLKCYIFQYFQKCWKFNTTELWYVLWVGVLLGLRTVTMFLNREHHQGSWVQFEPSWFVKKHTLVYCIATKILSQTPESAQGLISLSIDLCSRLKALNWWAIRTVSNLVSELYLH